MHCSDAWRAESKGIFEGGCNDPVPSRATGRDEFFPGEVDANGVRAEGSILNGISGQDVEMY